LSFIGFMGFQDEVFFVLLQTAKTMWIRLFQWFLNFCKYSKLFWKLKEEDILEWAIKNDKDFPISICFRKKIQRFPNFDTTKVKNI
jgi:hypothetical protein